MKAEAAFLRFHLRVGARLAGRILAPALATVLFLFYVLRPEFVLALARGLFIEGSPVESGLVGALLLLGMARAVVPRIAAGRAGWARSLPADGRVLRAMETLSSVVAEIPLLAVLGGLAWAVAGPRPAALRVAGLLVGAAAAGLLYLQGPSPFKAKIWPAVACFLSFSGNGLVLLVAVAALILALVGPAVAAKPRGRRQSRRRLPSALFFFGHSLRAVGFRLALGYLPASAVLAACRLFLANNELAADQAFAIALFGLTLGPAVFVGLEANALAARRPAWPWLRSLPLSAAARVRADALFLGFGALPLAAAGLAFLGRPARDAAFLAGPMAWIVIRGAGAMRGPGERRFGVVGLVFIEGAVLAAGVAVLPWISWVLAAATPLASIWARNAERRVKPTAWVERHHLSAGDPLSWSAS